MKYSGIGGQAVIEGVMMRNGKQCAVAVRKPDGEIEVKKETVTSLRDRYAIARVPVIRGIVSFVESLSSGMKTLNYSASFYEEEEEKQEKTEEEKKKQEKKDSILTGIVMVVSVFLALAVFLALPYLVSELLRYRIPSPQLRGLLEGVIRVILFVAYVKLISLMEDIHRVFMYHGAEHKCINCIENGARLTTENVMNSSRYHKRCGTSFLFIVMFISIVFFIFIRVDNTALQVVIRLLLVPVIAGVSYEFIRWAGKNDNGFTVVLSKPGMWLQRLTTREPDEEMVEVAIKAVEEVFDWKAFLKEYYAHSPNPEADMLASEAKLAMDGELIHKAKNTRKIDARKVAHEAAMAETIRAVEIKSVSNSDTTSDTKAADGKISDTEKEEVVMSETQDTADAVETFEDVRKTEDNLESADVAESQDDSAEQQTKENEETSQDTEEALPEGFEIEEEYETVNKIEGAAGGEYAVTTEKVPETDESENMTVEEVEAGFEIEEPEDTEEAEDINADDVPLFKQRDRH